MDLKTYSIIIPHFNTPILLRRLLESIPLDESTEVIVVDDNSTKMLSDYEKVKEDYSQRGVSFLKNSSGKQGAGLCRNIGVSKAVGKWLIFADSDDYFSKEFREIVDEWKDASEDIVFFYPTSADSDSGEISDRHYEFVNILKAYKDNPTKENELRLRFQLVAPWGKLIKRSLVTDNDISFEDTRVANDVLFCRKIGLKANNIAVSDRVLYTVTTRPGSLTSFKDGEAFDIRLDVFIRSTRYIRNNIDKESFKKAHLNGSYFIHKCRVEKLGFTKLVSTVWKLLINGIAPINI